MHAEGFGDLGCCLALFGKARNQGHLLGAKLWGRPNLTPRDIAALRPAPVRSRMSERSNSAIPPNTVRIIFPAADVVSAQG